MAIVTFGGDRRFEVITTDIFMIRPELDFATTLVALGLHTINIVTRVRTAPGTPQAITWGGSGNVLEVTIGGNVGPLGVSVETPTHFGMVANQALFFQLTCHQIGNSNLVHFLVLAAAP